MKMDLWTSDCLWSRSTPKGWLISGCPKATAGWSGCVRTIRLRKKEVITKEDLFGLPLILPERIGVQSELANWFGKDLAKLRVAFTSNLGTNAGVMAMHGLGYPVSIEGAAKYWGKSRLIQKHLYPEIKSGVIMAWRRNIPYSQAVQKMIEKMQEFETFEMSKRRRS